MTPDRSSQSSQVRLRFTFAVPDAAPERACRRSLRDMGTPRSTVSAAAAPTTADAAVGDTAAGDAAAAAVDGVGGRCRSGPTRRPHPHPLPLLPRRCRRGLGAHRRQPAHLVPASLRPTRSDAGQDLRSRRWAPHPPDRACRLPWTPQRPLRPLRQPHPHRHDASDCARLRVVCLGEPCGDASNPGPWRRVRCRIRRRMAQV